MKDEPKGQPDHGPPSQSPLNFERVGNLIVVERRHRPDIPEGKGRSCPQCGECAWIESRFCWNCQFDFDRAELPRCHPRKLLLVAVSINLVALALVIAWHLNEKHPPNPTRSDIGSSRTPVLALAGTLEARLGAHMTEERKVDLRGIWGQRPSADILETRRAQQRPAAAPLVTVGSVQGNVITINSAAGLDLSALLAKAQGGEP